VVFTLFHLYEYVHNTDLFLFRDTVRQGTIYCIHVLCTSTLTSIVFKPKLQLHCKVWLGLRGFYWNVAQSFDVKIRPDPLETKFLF